MHKVLVSKRQTTPEIADDEIADVGAGISTSGDTLTIGEGKTVVMPGVVQRLSVTFDFEADGFVDLAAGVKTLEKTIELPEGAHLFTCTATDVTPFEIDQTDTFGITIGTSTGGTQVAASLNVAYGQTGFPKAFTAGSQGYLMAPHSGQTLYVKLTSADDLLDAVAGAATVNVFFVVMPA